jgi:hypothetical protein
VRRSYAGGQARGRRPLEGTLNAREDRAAIGGQGPGYTHVTDLDSMGRLQELLGELDAQLAALEGTDASEEAVDRLTSMAELAREVQAEIDRLRREEGDAPA